MFNFFEFFAGGGMVRAGLGPKWACAFANDSDSTKARTYAANWGSERLVVKDIQALDISDLPGQADLAWASFPCQDVSCAGNGTGIGEERGKQQTRSGTFWPFIALMRGLKAQNRAPNVIVVENVIGLLTTNSGVDFRSVVIALANLQYKFGAIVVDARYLVPQSRPRVFIIAVASNVRIPDDIQVPEPKLPWHPELVVKAWRSLPAKATRRWIWFDCGKVPTRRKKLSAVVSDEPSDAEWHTKAETRRLIAMMSDINLRKLREAKRTGRRMVASLFLRMRPVKGVNRQHAEINFSDVAGCLRTPRGGGSRPRILIVHGNKIKSRLLSPREAATLMGLDKNYKLPSHYEPAYRVIGDGVVVPAVTFIKNRLLEPIVVAAKRSGTGRQRLKAAARKTKRRRLQHDRNIESAFDRQFG